MAEVPRQIAPPTPSPTEPVRVHYHLALAPTITGAQVTGPERTTSHISYLPPNRLASLQRFWVLALVSVVTVLTSKGFAQSTTTQTDVPKVVSHCVGVVRKVQPPPAVIDIYGPAITSFYKNFDAFYNPASGLVQNNAGTVGGQPALFAFQKCMTENGVPLK